MRIIANVRGTFLEPVGNFGVRDAVSFLQLQAMVPQEALLLQQMYRVLRDGGVIRAVADAGTINVRCEFPGESQAVVVMGCKAEPLAEIPEEPQTIPPEPISPEVEGVTPTLTCEDPLPDIQDKHRHVYSTAQRCVYEPEGLWMQCECGEWDYFPRLILITENFEVTKDPKKKPN